MGYFVDALGALFSFGGRMKRLPYFGLLIFTFIIESVIIGLAIYLRLMDAPRSNFLLILSLAIPPYYSQCAFTVRRLRDTGWPIGLVIMSPIMLLAVIAADVYFIKYIMSSLPPKMTLDHLHAGISLAASIGLGAAFLSAEAMFLPFILPRSAKIPEDDEDYVPENDKNDEQPKKEIEE
ncbi:MAG: DUF805 domain-containing protein [Schwartzia sp.]|nr:DUF805 domain-containing protein [Schwartzia sp. (in: firmicutes)]